MISISSILGFASVLAIFVFAILTSTQDYMLFVNIPSLALVLGGTIGSGFVGYGVKTTLKSLLMILGLLKADKFSDKYLLNLIDKIIEWNKINRTKGHMALENIEVPAGEKLLKDGLELVSSGYDKSNVEQILVIKSHAEEKEEQDYVNSLLSLASFAPSFGMIGTIVGLVIMLNDFGSEVNKLGVGLSIALITTLYGILLAQILFKPSAIQLQKRLEQKIKKDDIIIKSLSSFQDKLESMVLRDKLTSILINK
jgi:chemotaxis protein MotA